MLFTRTDCYKLNELMFLYYRKSDKIGKKNYAIQTSKNILRGMAETKNKKRRKLQMKIQMFAHSVTIKRMILVP